MFIAGFVVVSCIREVVLRCRDKLKSLCLLFMLIKHGKASNVFCFGLFFIYLFIYICFFSPKATKLAQRFPQTYPSDVLRVHDFLHCHLSCPDYLDDRYSSMTSTAQASWPSSLDIFTNLHCEMKINPEGKDYNPPPGLTILPLWLVCKVGLYSNNA